MNKNKLQNRSSVGAVAIGTVSALLVTLLSAVIIAICMNGEYIGLKRVEVSSHIVHVLGTFLGCMITAMLCPDKRLVTTLITAGAYFCFLIISACLFCGRLGVGVTAGACSVAMSALTVLFLVQHKKKARFPRRYNRRNG